MADNQSNHTDDQNFDIDLDKFYSDFINEIDKARSHVSVANNPAILTQFINAISQQTVGSTSTSADPNTYISQLRTETTPQESRAHTFYRMLGLPVIEPGGELYSPGFDKQNGRDPAVKQQKSRVISKIPKALYKLMEQRESNVNQFLSIFSVNTSINASVLALSSTQLRSGDTPFSAVLTKLSDPFDSNLLHQNYSVKARNVSNTADLLSYQDSSGNTAIGLGGLISTRSHIIAPLIVDPRVDFTVNPPYRGEARKLFLAPFVTDKSFALYAEDIYLNPPIIDAICRARFDTSTSSDDLNQSFKDIISFVQNTNTVIDPSLLNQVFGEITQTPSTSVFFKLINAMRSMVDQLVQAIHDISEVEQQFHWVPVPDQKGPEFGSSVIAVNFIRKSDGTVINDPLNRQKDTDILQMSAKSILGAINTQSSEPVQVDLGNFILSNIQAVPDTQATNSLGDRNADNLQDLTDRRTTTLNKANTALRKIEIIMGEFSGLGLADILAIYTALWTVDATVLVNMLDNQAFNRMIQNSRLQSPEVKSRMSANAPTMSGTDVLKAFQAQVLQIYNFMDKLFKDQFNNKITTSS